MPLAKRWCDLDREAVARAPRHWGVYELGRDGTVVSVGAGMLRDELKDALAYADADADADQVRFETADSREHAERLAEDHRRRLG